MNINTKRKALNTQTDDLSEVVQSQISQKWLKSNDTKYILHIGPTCSGKTFRAIERLKIAEAGAYLAPLRLLAWEISEKLNDAGIKCSLLTGEERIPMLGATITSSTIEMLDYETIHDIAVIDECLMVSDKDRGKHWLKAILEIQAKEVHLILNDESELLITEILSVTSKSFTINKYQRLTELRVSDKAYPIAQPLNKTIFVVFSRIKALVYKSFFEEKGFNVSILYGNLPPETKKIQISKFISGENQICISTDVIGMGINLPCEHVCFLELQKFDGENMRQLQPMEIKQIGGRAGRYGYADVGFVCAPHANQIPFIQNAITTTSRLEKAYWGLDYNTFVSIPKGKVHEKIKYFKSMQCIPKELTHIVQKENADRILILSETKGLDNLDMELQWALINSPVKKNNEDYFTEIVFRLDFMKRIIKPSFLNGFRISVISDTTMLEFYETNLSQIDLYCYYFNNSTTKSLVEDKDFEPILRIKNEIIDRINTFLVDKKKSSLKKCGQCDNTLDISWPHKNCNDCFRSNRRRNDYY